MMITESYSRGYLAHACHTSHSKDMNHSPQEASQTAVNADVSSQNILVDLSSNRNLSHIEMSSNSDSLPPGGVFV